MGTLRIHWTLPALLVLISMGLEPRPEATIASRVDAARYGDASAEEVELGKTLFFDARLSYNGTMSCATCHQPEKGFADGKQFSTGASGKVLARHTPHLFNLADASSYFWDGRATSLEEQARMVLENPDELNQPLDELVEKLGAVPAYQTAFQRVYPRKGLSERTIPRALAAFVASLKSVGSDFDRYREGNRDALSEPATRGMTMFFGRGRCGSCHIGPDLRDGEFHNTGIPGEDRGRAVFDRVGEFQTRPYPFFQMQKAFKTPSLRNVALTAPYFHDGSEPTLEDVVRFYNQGGKDPNAPGLASDVRHLGLSDSEVDDLVAFLQALTSRVDIVLPATAAESRSR